MPYGLASSLVRSATRTRSNQKPSRPGRLVSPTALPATQDALQSKTRDRAISDCEACRGLGARFHSRKRSGVFPFVFGLRREKCKSLYQIIAPLGGSGLARVSHLSPLHSVFPVEYRFSACPSDCHHFLNAFALCY